MDHEQIQHEINRLARDAGKMILNADSSALSGVEVVTKSSRRDLVTSMDLEIQQMLMKELLRLIPQAKFLCEEDVPSMPDAVKAGDIIRAKAGTYQAFNFRRPFSGLQNCLQHLIILCKDADNCVSVTPFRHRDSVVPFIFALCATEFLVRSACNGSSAVQAGSPSFVYVVVHKRFLQTS